MEIAVWLGPDGVQGSLDPCIFQYFQTNPKLIRDSS